MRPLTEKSLWALMEAAYNAEREFLKPVAPRPIPAWDELDEFDYGRLWKMVRAVVSNMDKCGLSRSPDGSVD